MNTKSIFIIGFFAILIFIMLGCNLTDNSKQKVESEQSVKVETSQEYLNKYEGGYFIEVKGITSSDTKEAYLLTKNGIASWMYIVDDGKGNTNVKEKKTGSWAASENLITIGIEGKTGLIYENYKLENNIFVQVNNPQRYLIKTE